ncbi:erythromycin esterase [Spongiactinospora gelatinilytica]|uniref:Erythromycin esterase n=2 Tax=Spongiactinospora gelatinilytica TaxID=2666298 RepID=A0A2W2GW61_9ACTN|nr:erythromycin esterase [Spongiactinospora gelatinilytica]
MDCERSNSSPGRDPMSGSPQYCVMTALRRSAYPLRTTEPYADRSDLEPLGKLVADACVVGLGQATHNSHEFFTMKHRIFRYLVEKLGFTTFALEANWSAGLRLNDYVLHGKGDPRQIMDEEFQGSYVFWNTLEHLDLIEWMRAHNERHERKVQFMGADIGHAGEELYDRVLTLAMRHAPRLGRELAPLYRQLRPEPGAGAWPGHYLAKPLEERRWLVFLARRALALLRRHPWPDACSHAWAVRHAKVIAQTWTLYAHDLDDPAQLAQGLLHRDMAMAENTVWWRLRTGHRMLLSAHNAHVAYESFDPEHYPRVLGAFLRQYLGQRYVNVGFTFHRGSFNAWNEANNMTSFTVGPAASHSNEHTLDQIDDDDHLLDLRTVPARARAWLQVPRPTGVVGTVYPVAAPLIRLAHSYDMLIHLRRITAAHLLA